MQEYLPKRAYLVCLLLLLFQLCWAQSVRPIRISDSNARQYRDSLKLKIFGTSAFPYNLMPDSVISNVDTIDYYPGVMPYSSITYPAGNLDSIDKIVVSLDPDTSYFPVKVTSYLFHPHNGNGKLFIYHSGHCAGVTVSEDIIGNNNGIEPGVVIPKLVAEGYTVLAVPMLYYKNLIPPGLSCTSNGHNDLFIDNHYTSPLRFFFKPLIASLNQLGRSNYSAIYMCGLSGGGWTTTVYPAIDSSIVMAFPVAGSWPMPVRYVYYPPLGDEEQIYIPFTISFLDYHELYTLACLAPDRKMLQINNRFDPCCFSGPVGHIFYVDSVATALKGTNGIFKFYLDETGTNHAITTKAVQVMLKFIENDTAYLEQRPRDTATNGSNYFYDIRSNFKSITVNPGAVLKFSLLKAPDWLSLDTLSGQLQGTVPLTSIIVHPDTISFKAEDTAGRFVVYNYQLKRKRESAYFFTAPGDNSTVYFLPPFLNSLDSIDPSITHSFYFNDPLISVTGISLVNYSYLKLKLSQPLSMGDSISYKGYYLSNAITYRNGTRVDNTPLMPINMNVVKTNLAVTGMIRFNKDTLKFEYFNGVIWLNLNQ